MKIRINLDINDIEDFIDMVIGRYHFEATDKKQLLDIYQQLQLVITPYAEYRINQYSTGIEMIDRGTATAVAMSLGAGVDKLQDRYVREEKLSEAYMIDCLASELLLIMYKEFNASYARFHRRYVDRYVFVGDQIPASSIQDILNNIRGKRKCFEAEDKNEKSEEVVSDSKHPLEYTEDIMANEYGVLTPSKSVVFYAVLSENPATKCQGICMGCGKADCENRLDIARQLPEGLEKKQGETKEKKQSNIVELNYGYQKIFGGGAK